MPHEGIMPKDLTVVLQLKPRGRMIAVPGRRRDKESRRLDRMADADRDYEKAALRLLDR
jgi:hypothetical protein